MRWVMTQPHDGLLLVVDDLDVACEALIGVRAMAQVIAA